MREERPHGRRRIHLMRHAEVSYVDPATRRLLDPRMVELTADGERQAEAARAALAATPLDRVVCSGLPRTRRTAALVAAGRGLAVEDRPDLIEIRSGRLSDVPPERFDAEFVYGFEAAAAPGARFAGGEAFADFERRVVAAFEALLAEPGWESALVVAHEGVNRMALAWAAGAGLAGLGAFDQDMACINVLDVDVADGRIVRRLLRTVNLTPYDPTKNGLHLTALERLARTFRVLHAPVAAEEGGTP